jgi:hypothetical protein
MNKAFLILSVLAVGIAVVHGAQVLTVKSYSSCDCTGEPDSATVYDGKTCNKVAGGNTGKSLIAKGPATCEGGTELTGQWYSDENCKTKKGVEVKTPISKEQVFNKCVGTCSQFVNVSTIYTCGAAASPAPKTAVFMPLMIFFIVIVSCFSQ